MSAPKLLSRKGNDTTPSHSTHDAPKAPRIKAPPEGEKVVVRRLPPALTEEEFIAILGDTWKLGNGKVDWFSYWPGKVSQHPSKPSRPSRAYLHVRRRDDLLALSETVRTAAWQDDKGTHTDPALVFPPAVEFSIYKKVPSDKKRTDSRQGTIDQDPEFMAFLESLANPDAHKDVDADLAADAASKAEKVTTTPLIEFLKEKKAAKAKDSAAAKSAKHSRQDSQGGKGKAPAGSSEDPKKKTKESRSEKAAEKVAAAAAAAAAADKSPEKSKQWIKILAKKAPAIAAAEAAKVAAKQIESNAPSTAPAASHEPLPKNRRAGIAAAARILQRDLGLSPGNAHRKARQEAAKADAEAKASGSGSGSKESPKEAAPPTPQEPASPSTPITPSAPAAPQNPQAAPAAKRSRPRKRDAGTSEEPTKIKGEGKSGGKGEGKAEKSAESSSQAPQKPPVILMKKKDTAPSVPASSSSAGPSTASATIPTAPSAAKNTPAKQTSGSKKGGSSNAPTPGATRAFVKHANPSQGVTEALLRETLQAFGSVTSVEIERKKGFAYVEFAEASSLVKAMAASPLTVAQATVQVLERKEVGKKSAGGNTKGGGGSGASASTAVPATPATPATPTEPSSSTAVAPATTAGPSTEKGSAPQEKEKHRSGRRRGGRGRGDKEAGTKEGSAVGSASGGGKNTEGGGG